MRWEGSSGLPTANWPCLLFAFNPKYCFISEMKEKGPSRNILGKINRRMDCIIYLCNIWKIETEHWMNGRFVLDKREVVLGSSDCRCKILVSSSFSFGISEIRHGINASWVHEIRAGMVHWARVGKILVSSFNADFFMTGLYSAEK